jgi:hypothetical protein
MDCIENTASSNSSIIVAQLFIAAEMFLLCLSLAMDISSHFVLLAFSLYITIKYKIWTYNFIIYSCVSDKGCMFMWDEATAKSRK